MHRKMAATATHEGVVMCLPLFAAKKDADAFAGPLQREFFRIGKQSQFDFCLAALANGSLKVKNPDGSGRYSDDYGVAPALGLTFRHRF